MSMDLYQATCLACSRIITRRYSTSFTLGIRSLHRRFRLPIYAISRHHRICNRMCLYRGVEPMFADFSTSNAPNPYAMALDVVRERELLRSGERVTITCGDLANVPGVTNTLKVLEY